MVARVGYRSTSLPLGFLLLCVGCAVSEGSYAPEGGGAAGRTALSGGSGGTRNSSAGTTSAGKVGSGTCGNGTLDSGEVCDNGRFNSDTPAGACRTDCKLARCGDGIQDAVEECDGGTGCSVDCKKVSCGDGRPDEGEECDPPATGTCTKTCRAIRCGDERLDGTEECDPPRAGSCSDSCKTIKCGNARVDDGEECDPPRVGLCSTTCQAIECGNGEVDEGEGCDPPATGACDDKCRPAGCGNGTVDAGEQCDPPMSGVCSAECKTITCGDSRTDEGEECDPPAAGTCNAQCQDTSCGNSRTDEGEDCDPPATGTCNAECQTIRCGDGRVDPGELCEPMGMSDPACSATCAPTSGGGTAPTFLFTFDSDIQNWKLYQASPTSLASGTMLTFDAQNGDVSPGVLKVVSPFNANNQKIDFQVGMTTTLDLRGKTLKARVRLASGLSTDPAHPGGIKLFAKSGQNYDYASGMWTNLTPGGGWQDVTFVGDAPILIPGTFSAGEVREIGFELRTFNESMDNSAVQAATVFVDSISF